MGGLSLVWGRCHVLLDVSHVLCALVLSGSKFIHGLLTINACFLIASIFLVFLERGNCLWGLSSFNFFSPHLVLILSNINILQVL